MEKTSLVTVGADAAAPTVVVQINGATPVASYTAPVEVTVRATDGTGATGVEWIERRDRRRRVDACRQHRQRRAVRDQVQRQRRGSHTVEYRARDRAGNVSDPVGSVSSRSTSDGPVSCLPQSDEFNAATLDPKWTVMRAAGGGPTLINGSLALPMLQGDFIANDALASNTVLQDTPSGEWTATTRINTGGINANGEQAGLLLWKSENPNTFAKLVAIQANTGNRQYEYIVTQSGAVNPPIARASRRRRATCCRQGAAARPQHGHGHIGEFSGDDGATWMRIGQGTHAAPLTGAPSAPSPSAAPAVADVVRLAAPARRVRDYPDDVRADCSTQSDQFNGPRSIRSGR